jgi:hypothetical protein
VSFAVITICVASQRVLIVVIVVYFVIDSFRKLLDIASYIIGSSFKKEAAQYCITLVTIHILHGATTQKNTKCYWFCLAVRINRDHLNKRH